MEKTYNPQDIEQPLYEHWEKQATLSLMAMKARKVSAS